MAEGDAADGAPSDIFVVPGSEAKYDVKLEVMYDRASLDDGWLYNAMPFKYKKNR